MLINRNQLPPLDAVARPPFEVLFAQFKSEYIAEITAIDPVLAIEVAAALEVDGDLFSKMGQMFCQYLIAHMERINEQARQMLPATSRANNLDHVVSLQSLERQILDPGDPSAFPPVAATKEDDDHLLMRFWLAPHAPAAGSRLHYRFHAMTLDQRPEIKLEKPAENVVRVTYTFPETSIVSQIKDANGLQTVPGTVAVTVLANAGNGVPSAGLLSSVTEYFNRDDVRPETDNVTVQAASIVNYTMDVVCTINKGPDTSVLNAAMTAALAQYSQDQHKLAGKIQRTYIAFLMHQAGASNVVVNQPAVDVSTTDIQAPYCTGINLVVNAI